MVLTKRLLLVLLSVFWATQPLAQPAQLKSILEISALAEREPIAAIDAIDTLIGSGALTDQRSVFDLLLLKAELLESTGSGSDAAALYLQLAQAADRQREILGWDPITLIERAVVLFIATRDTSNVEQALLAIVDLQRDGGASADDIAATFDRLAANATGDASTEYGEAAEITRSEPAPTRDAGDAGGYREVEIFFATDRARTGDPDPAEFYGGDRGQLELGTALVTIPDVHEAGAVEAPSIWRLEFAPNPAKHVVLQSVTPVPEEAFFSRMNDTLDTLGSTDAFVFVHGYNVRFDAAAKRAAQLAYDMDFPGVPILYSWPSRGSTVGYIADTAVVRLSGRRLSGFLDDLVDRSGATTIHIVAHSMGNRALTDALELLALRRGLKPGSEPVFDQILFAAPDVDAELFAEMMPVIRPAARRLTLYASSEDWALQTSRQLHGDAPRAGQGGETLVAREEFDSVDMSELGEDMLAHSYFADDRSALADMVALFWRNAAPNVRCGLQARDTPEAEVPVWEYIAGSCADSTLVEIMTHLRQAKVTDAKTAQDIVASTVPDPAVAETLAPIVSKLFDN